MARAGSRFILQEVDISTMIKCVINMFITVTFSRRVHYNDIIMSAVASQITSLTIVYSTIYSVTDQRKHQSSTSQAFMRGIYRWLVNSPQEGPVTQKLFPLDDIIMKSYYRAALYCFVIVFDNSIFQNPLRESQDVLSYVHWWVNLTNLRKTIIS